MSAGSSPVSTRRRRVVTIIALIAVATTVLAYGIHRLSNSRSTQVLGELVQRVETDDRVVALTFDDGPDDDDFEVVLDALAERGVRATFYVNGQDVVVNAEAMRRIVADGHEIGNHTWSHRRMVGVTGTTVQLEVETTDTVIRATGYDGPLTFRPPYGAKLISLPAYLSSNTRLTVTWDVSVEDWSGQPQTSEEIAELTVAATRPGSIILLHPWFGRTPTQDAIGPIIDDLQAQGYEFLTVSELVE